MKLARLLARLVLGGLFIGHGTQKWFGWFGGPGLESTVGMTEKLEMRPARANAHLLSGTETFAGTLIAAGALTPLAASGLIATMITAIRKVHLARGPWNANGGYEFNLALIAGLLLLVEGGPGRPSLDSSLGLERSGSGWALLALAAGAAASTAAIEAGRRASAEDRGPEGRGASTEEGA